ncbi:MAG: NAD-dependent epimerase/dehydratase family protein [Planctomycetes bacterium]|nr:NAD-dependent epimerase/dehydratase family protein [Planctomycetota bacterium]NBY02596.1 NAD-dependent epimerase/dehydratase family protein [Planctomycetota bacterium]
MSAIDLVTGGAGFVGSHLVEALVGLGRKVRVLDDLSTGRFSNLSSVKSDVEFIEGTILSEDDLIKASFGVDNVYHLAAVASVQKSMEQPLLSHEVCATGTLKVLQASKLNRCKRFVFAASSSAYGSTGNVALDESALLNPLSPYASSKLAGEFHAIAFARAMGIETVRLRFFNIFGPKQRGDSPYSGVIAIFADLFKKEVNPTIFGDGLQSRDFIFVQDAVQALILAGTKSDISGEVFNIGTGKSTSLLDLVFHLQKLTGKNLVPQHLPARSGDVRYSLANIAKAQGLLGFAPKFDVSSGLKYIL